MKFFIYSRKSVCTGRGESVENQAELCRQYLSSKFPACSEHDITVYEDEGFSAKDTARPRFLRMLNDLRVSSPDYIVCYRLDRISRSVSDFSALIEELNRRGISFLCIREEFDTSKPMGKAMMYIASVFAQLERETIAERVRDNMLMLARTGRWLGGTAPTGYVREKVQERMPDGRIKSLCRLKDNPEELAAAGLIFEKYLELHSISGVSKLLIRRGITSRGGGFFSLSGIKQILQNPVYCIADSDAFTYFSGIGAQVCFDASACSGRCGLIAYNKRDYSRKSIPRRPHEQWIIAAGTHSGCVSGKQWAAVQHFLSGSRQMPRHRNDYALLSGTVFCQSCGSKMIAKRRCSSKASPGQFDYICARKLHEGTALCSCQNLNGPQTDLLVWQTLLPYAAKYSGSCEALKPLRRRLSSRSRPSHSMSRCKAELDRLMSALSCAELTPAFIRRISLRITELERGLSARSEKQPASIPTSFGQLAESLSLPEKRTLIGLMLRRAEWDGQALRLFLG